MRGYDLTWLQSDLTEDRLHNMSLWLPVHIEQPMATELLALRAENARLREALEKAREIIECDWGDEDAAALFRAISCQ